MHDRFGLDSAVSLRHCDGCVQVADHDTQFGTANAKLAASFVRRRVQGSVRSHGQARKQCSLVGPVVSEILSRLRAVRT